MENPTLASRITFAREQLGLTQVELALRCGISSAAINALEAGKSKALRGKTLLAMSVALGKSAEWLGGGLGPATETPTLSAEEQDLIGQYRKLNSSEKKVVVRAIRALAIDK